MAQPDYYSVMQKRIEYLAKKYDPYGRFSIDKEPLPEKTIEQKSKKHSKKIIAECAQFISMLF
jgi:hypothetical protein